MGTDSGIGYIGRFRGIVGRFKGVFMALCGAFLQGFVMDLGWIWDGIIIIVVTVTDTRTGMVLVWWYCSGTTCWYAGTYQLRVCIVYIVYIVYIYNSN